MDHADERVELTEEELEKLGPQRPDGMDSPYRVLPNMPAPEVMEPPKSVAAMHRLAKAVEMAEERVENGLNNDADGWQFARTKEIVLNGGPLDRSMVSIHICDADALIYFFRNRGDGEIEQAVYRIALVEKERTEEEKLANVPREWDWVGEFVGKRRIVKKEVSGVRKGPSSTGIGVV